MKPWRCREATGRAMWPHAVAGGVARTLPASPLLPLLLLSVAGAAHDPFFCLMSPSSSLSSSSVDSSWCASSSSPRARPTCRRRGPRPNRQPPSGAASKVVGRCNRCGRRWEDGMACARVGVRTRTTYLVLSSVYGVATHLAFVVWGVAWNLSSSFRSLLGGHETARKFLISWTRPFRAKFQHF